MGLYEMPSLVCKVCRKVGVVNSKVNSGIGRREFLRYGIYAAAFSPLLTGCRQPVREAVPHVSPPDDVLPGSPAFYASSYFDGHHFAPVEAKVIDGRPIKIDGNRLCPLTGGGTTARTQASLMELYDPGRLPYPASGGDRITWEEMDRQVVKILKRYREENRKIWILTRSLMSPSFKGILERFVSLNPSAELISYDPLSSSALVDAHRICFDFPHLPEYRFDRADLVLSLHCDFLGTWISPAQFSRQYISARENQKEISFEHIQMEAGMSLTGSNATRRILLHHGEEQLMLAAIYNKIASLKKRPERVKTESPPPTIAADLSLQLLKASAPLVVSGSNRPETQQLVCAINDLLGSYGTTILWNPCHLRSGNEHLIDQFLESVRNDPSCGVICYQTDPVDELDPALTGQLQALELSVTISTHSTATSRASSLICSEHHPFEVWRDYAPLDGLVYFSQPLLQPLFDTRQGEEIFMRWIGESGTFRRQLEDHWSAILPEPALPSVYGDLPWVKTLREGYFCIPGPSVHHNPPDMDHHILESVQTSGVHEGLELSIYEAVNYGAGAGPGNPWLLELPDPMTRISYENYAAISPWLAEVEGLKEGDWIEINHSLEVPVLIQPGQADRTISVAWGYGRKGSGFFSTPSGVSLSGWTPLINGYRQMVHTVLSIRKTGKNTPFAKFQIQDDLLGRDHIRSVAEEDRPHQGSLPGFYEPYPYPGHRWGMVVDLDRCTGCNACVVACQVENNIPVVGKEEVARHHDMYWLRIDRYYAESGDEIKVLRQPVMCQHCGHAPCESVCPVVATTHSHEGINQMIYNRCIGTRYCSNNCPYKTRVFNWFDYNGADAIIGNSMDVAGMTADLPRMAVNPEVTQRAKGVMEKCTFCIQRIEEAKISAKRENRSLKDGEIETACMQACPTNAIVFGDLNDPKSKVSRLAQESRAYRLLEELNTKPAVAYLKRTT